MLNLFILLLERVGLIILLAYILININHFKTMMRCSFVFLSFLVAWFCLSRIKEVVQSYSWSLFFPSHSRCSQFFFNYYYYYFYFYIIYFIGFLFDKQDLLFLNPFLHELLCTFLWASNYWSQITLSLNSIKYGFC